MRAASAAVQNEPPAWRITSQSIIGMSDKVQAALVGLQAALAAVSERLGMRDTTEAVVDELRALCLQLRRQLVKTVGQRAVTMELVLRNVLDWSQDAQVCL
jgi:hypothetical protein